MQEVYSAFQEMALAGYLKGTYNGAAFGTAHYSPGTSLPSSGYNKSVYWFPVFNFWGMMPSNSNILFIASLNYLQGYAPLITSSHAFAIDMKVDDGKPFTGRYFAYSHTTGTPAICANWVGGNVSWPTGYAPYLASNPAIYTNDSTLCSMGFRLD